MWFELKYWLSFVRKGIVQSSIFWNTREKNKSWYCSERCSSPGDIPLNKDALHEESPFSGHTGFVESLLRVLMCTDTSTSTLCWQIMDVLSHMKVLGAIFFSSRDTVGAENFQQLPSSMLLAERLYLKHDNDTCVSTITHQSIISAGSLLGVRIYRMCNRHFCEGWRPQPQPSKHFQCPIGWSFNKTLGQFECKSVSNWEANGNYKSV